MRELIEFLEDLHSLPHSEALEDLINKYTQQLEHMETAYEQEFFASTSPHDHTE